MKASKDDEVRAAVRKTYMQVAISPGGRGGSSCCSGVTRANRKRHCLGTAGLFAGGCERRTGGRQHGTGLR